MNWLVLVTSCMFYSLDLVQKMPKLKLTTLGYLLYYLLQPSLPLLLKITCVFWGSFFLEKDKYNIKFR